jgi:asparagine synthase (glutamine-hydrolysing)
VCGIFGITGSRADSLGGPVLDACLQDLAERGPDDRGVYRNPGVVLAHTRLSIIDLSPAGHQPMASADGSVVVVFNGEIYGFVALRAELERLGHSFTSRSDTEVILAAYAEWGRDMLAHLEGMFALGLYDRRSETLLLARDRMGKKPLFWTHAGDSLAFASLVRPLARSRLARARVSVPRLREYLFFDYTIAPATIFDDVRALEPGGWLEFRRGHVQSGRYWTLAGDDEAVSHRSAAGALQSELERRITDAVNVRLVSDAPLGIFLSSGLDSLAVAALAVRASESRRKTFTVGFAEASYDERPRAARAAAVLGTEHHETLCTPDDVPALLASITRSADHLLADQSMIPIAKLARDARAHVKVVLTGDGGDEMLAGYPTYRALALARHYVRLPRSVRRAAAALSSYIPADPSRMSRASVAGRFFVATTGGLAEAHASWRAIWSHREIDSLLGRRSADAVEWQPYAEAFVERQNWSWLHSAVHADVATWLVDSILAKVDRSTMAVGLEARSPLLDRRVVELAFRRMLGPETYRDRKAPLRALVARLYGPELASAEKGQFQTPLSSWFAGPLRPWVREQLSALQRTLPDLFARSVIERVEHEHASRRRDHGLKLWSLVALAEWSKLYPGLEIDV